MQNSNNIQEIQSKIDNYETKANSIRVVQKSPCHIILSIFTLGILAIVRACILGDLECKIKNLKDRINVIKNQPGEVSSNIIVDIDSIREANKVVIHALQELINGDVKHQQLEGLFDPITESLMNIKRSFEGKLITEKQAAVKLEQVQKELFSKIELIHTKFTIEAHGGNKDKFNTVAQKLILTITNVISQYKKEGDKNNSRAKTHRIKFYDKVAVLPFNYIDAAGAMLQNHPKVEESINFSGDTRSHKERFQKSRLAAFQFKLAELQALENSGVNRSTVAVNHKEVLLPPNEGLKGILKGAKSTQPKRFHFEPV